MQEDIKYKNFLAFLPLKILINCLQEEFFFNCSSLNEHLNKLSGQSLKMIHFIVLYKFLVNYYKFLEVNFLNLYNYIFLFFYSS